MFLLTVFSICVAIVWALVVLKFVWRSQLGPVPLLGLLTLISGVVFGYHFFHESVGPIPVTIDRLILACAVGVYLLLAMLGHERIQQLTRLDALVIAFLGFVTLSTFSNDWTYRDNLPLGRLLFFNLLPVILYLVMRNANLSKGHLKVISLGLSGLAIYLAITAIGETQGWSWLVYPGYILTSSEIEFLGRGRGPLLNPVSNGMFMTIGLVATLMWWPRVSKRGKLVIIALSLLIGVGAFLTLTRSIWVCLAAAVFWFVWVPASRPQKGTLVIVGTAMALLLVVVSGDKVFSFKRDKFVTEAEMQQSATLRPLFAIVATRMFADRPLVGHGYGQYTQAKQSYLKDPTSTYPLYITKPYMQHNVVLSYMTELGLIGTSLFLILISSFAWIGWRLWQRRENELWIRQFGLLLVVLLCCHMINGMFHDVSIIPMGNALLFFVAGITTNLHANGSQHQLTSLSMNTCVVRQDEMTEKRAA